MANVQLENGYIRIAFDLFNELNFRDFNRMHLNILNFIIRLSYGCKKKYAYISPKSLFRLYGVNKNYIKQSLDYLINNKIIIVQNDKYYSINKNFDEWTVPYKAGVNFEEFKKIVSENLYSNHQNGDDYNHQNDDDCHHQNSDTYHQNSDGCNSNHQNDDDSNHQNSDDNHHQNSDTYHQNGDESNSNHQNNDGDFEKSITKMMIPDHQNSDDFGEFYHQNGDDYKLKNIDTTETDTDRKIIIIDNIIDNSYREVEGKTSTSSTDFSSNNHQNDDTPINELEIEAYKKDLENWHGEYSNVHLDKNQYGKLLSMMLSKELLQEIIDELSANIAAKKEKALPYDEKFPEMHFVACKNYWNYRRQNPEKFRKVKENDGYNY